MQDSIATSRTRLWPASGWECQGRHLSKERRSPGRRCAPLPYRRPGTKRGPIPRRRARREEPLRRESDVENFLELGGCFLSLVATKVDQAAYIAGEESPDGPQFIAKLSPTTYPQRKGRHAVTQVKRVRGSAAARPAPFAHTHSTLIGPDDTMSEEF